MQQYEEYSDLELVRLFKTGDRNAFTAIYDRFFGVLYVHAFNRLKNEAEAKDAIQDLFINMWNKREAVDLSNLSNYLYTSVRNRVLNIVAHRAVQQKYLAALPHEIIIEDCHTDYRLRERQLSAIISKEIALLPPKMRHVFELSRIHNLSHKEIADQLGISEQSVRSHVKNALKILRTRLGLVLYLVFLIAR